jgi:hypothetical protein
MQEERDRGHLDLDRVAVPLEQSRYLLRAARPVEHGENAVLHVGQQQRFVSDHADREVDSLAGQLLQLRADPAKSSSWTTPDPL